MIHGPGALGGDTIQTSREVEQDPIRADRWLSDEISAQRIGGPPTP
ncbi:MAG: hypothetical protein U0R18_21305 [Mycobacterium sp.]